MCGKFAPRENLELRDKLHFFCFDPFSCSFVLCLNHFSLNWANHDFSLNWANHAPKSTAISEIKALALSLAVAQAVEEVWWDNIFPICSPAFQYGLC